MQLVRRVLRITKTSFSYGKASMYILALIVGLFIYTVQRHSKTTSDVETISTKQLTFQNGFMVSGTAYNSERSSRDSMRFNDDLYMNKSEQFIVSPDTKLLKESPELSMIDPAVVRALRDGSSTDNATLKSLLAKQDAQIRKGITDRLLVTAPPVEPVLFRKRKLVLWVPGMSRGSSRGLRHLLAPLGVRFVDQPHPPDCSQSRCGKDMKLADRKEFYQDMAEQFHLSHKKDDLVQQIDAFVCVDPPADCQFFMPFQKSLIVLAGYRYEAARISIQDWQVWNENLARIPQDPTNTVAATGLYYANYMTYFTGIKPEVLQSYNGYLDASYDPSKNNLLLISSGTETQGLNKIFLAEFSTACAKLHCPKQLGLKHFRSLYQEPGSGDLASHPGLVYIPQRLSSSSIFEHFRMNIPMFFPSLSLLIRWQKEHGILSRDVRSTAGSPLPPHPVQEAIPDPNNLDSDQSLEHWLPMADFYQLPYITHYDSAEDLVRRLMQTDFRVVSRRMRGYNVKAKEVILHQWREILQRVAKYSPNNPH